MDKEELKKLAKDKRFISGIYNYCDRWCERCPFTTRCLNYETGEQHFSEPESRDIHNKLFWEKLSEVFQQTMEMIKEMAEEQGIDLNSIDNETIAEEEKQLKQSARNHECTKSAETYHQKVDDWFDSAGNLFKVKSDELVKNIHLEVAGLDPSGEATSIKDAIEVIRWYKYQIYVKLMRAVTGQLKGVPEIIEDFPKDSDGSAKVAFIGIDRSLAAWGILLKYFPGQEDEILPILVHLEQLRKNTEKTFPDARAFVRPGFDEKPD
ncbi:hypothetical protein ES705_24837 [subsurface metagenome]